MFPPRACAAVTAIALAAAPGLARAAALSEDFESGAPGWQATGLWGVQEEPATVTVSPAIAGGLSDVPAGATLPVAWSGSGAAWFGDPATGTYCVGYASVSQHPSDGCRSNGPVSGALTSPRFSVPAGEARLSFAAWWEVSGGQSQTADALTVDLSVDDGTTWSTAARLNPVRAPYGALHQPRTSGGLRAAPVWRPFTLDLAAPAGAEVRVRFRFDSGDDLGQGFRGVLIDDISIEGSEVPGEVAAAPGPAPSESGPAGGAQLPAGPVSGRTALLEPVSGRSAYTTPGAAAPTRLVVATLVPIGTVVDASSGEVRLTTAAGAGTQSGLFHGGVFQIRQEPDAVLVELALRGGRFPRCERGCTSRVRSVRHLWGNAKGRFRTRGQYAAATVRGTNWLVEDRSSETRVTVRAGTTQVRDFILDRTVFVRAGETYIARALYTNRQPGNPRRGRQYSLLIRNGKTIHVYREGRVVVSVAS